MDKLDKELSNLFEDSEYLPKLSYLKDNLKTHRLFKKFKLVRTFITITFILEIIVI